MTIAAERSKTKDAEKSRRWRAKNQSKKNEMNLRWRVKNREKYLAHKKFEREIRSGRLNRVPCEVCGDTRLVHAHHDDYSKQLDVMWLCPTHHKERHRHLNESPRPSRAA